MGMTDGTARIGKTIKHAIDKFIGVIVETRKNYNQTVFIYNPSGDDSVPCKNDKVIILKVDGTGNFIGAGILTESQGAKPGEKIFFGRDTDGKITSKLSMLGNGNVKLEAEKDVSQNIKGKYYIGNEASNIQKLLIELVDEIENIMTFGAPPQHKIHPDTKQSLENYKNKIKELFKEGA